MTSFQLMAIVCAYMVIGIFLAGAFRATKIWELILTIVLWPAMLLYGLGVALFG